MKPFFDPLDEFERIARNRPHPAIKAKYPKTTDGSLAAIIQEKPKRIVQQLPTGVIKSNSSDKWRPIIAQFVLNEQILPRANCQAEPLQKTWIAGQKADTFGFQFSNTFFGYDGEDYSTDFRLPYVKDGFFEKGKMTLNDCNYFFVRCYYQKSDLEAIIKKETKLEEASKPPKEDKKAKKSKKKTKEEAKSYSTGWRVKALQNALDTNESDKESESRSYGEKEKNADTSGIEIIHGFQEGKGNSFISYIPATKEVCRVKKNKDARGKMPIQGLYANIDLESPLGRGAVELSGGIQNFIDSSLQAYQYMMGLQMNPPLKKRGNSVDMSSLRYEWNAIWDMGSDANSDVEAVQISTVALTNFDTIYGLAKSQILNLNNSNDTSISATVGNPGFSKTDAGVDAMSARLGVSDNYARKQMEAWLGEVYESLINIYFGEKSGKAVLDLDEETFNKLISLDEPEVDKMLDVKKQQFKMDYDDWNDVALYFEVEPTTSAAQDSDNDRNSLIEILDLSMKYPILGELMGADGVRELVNRIIVKSKVEDPEKILPKPQAGDEEESAALAEAGILPEGIPPEMAQQMLPPEAQMQQPMPEQMMPEAPLAPQEAMPVPEQAPVQPELSPEMAQYAQTLIDEGIPAEDVIAIIEQSMVNARGGA